MWSPRSPPWRAPAARTVAVRAMDDWWAEFRDVARVALKGRPDLLNALGL